MRIIEHWIGGRTFSSSNTRRAPVFNPATGESQAEVSLADVSVVDQAVATARAAFEDWSQSSLSRRTKVLFRFREELNRRASDIASVITAEHGKTHSDALGEVQRGLDVVEYACGIPTLLKGEYSDQVSVDVDSYSFRQPLGVVAGVTPFNFPAMVPAWMYPVAIACGNAFVLKPSERDPTASNLVAELWAEAGLPPGVFNVVHGDKVAVDALLEHPAVAAVSFVGSTPVARYVHERGVANAKRVQALGGAKNHAIVLPDANVDYVADQLSAAAFGSAGERCMAVSAAVTVEDGHEQLLESIQERARAIRVGPGAEPTSEMGPVISGAARERIVSIIASGEQQGAQIAVDGRKITVPGHGGGFFVGPTVIANVKPHMDVYTSEIFGPVLSLLQSETLDEAIDLINRNPFGNGAAIFTSSGGAARKFLREVQVGMVGVNVPIPVPMAFHSFGGWKESLFGEYHVHGPEGVAFYTQSKAVTSRWPDELATEVSFDMPTGR
jgi:malonate-semialdehyde dehydrogenase (acetylating) / methylmalonate-semialdehyde dehydrogenase